MFEFLLFGMIPTDSTQINKCFNHPMELKYKVILSELVGEYGVEM
jgi:hypothetical protein